MNCPQFRPDSRRKQKGSSTGLGTGLCLTSIDTSKFLTGDVRRRRWTTEQKLTTIEQSFEPGETVSSAACRHGVAPICFTGSAGEGGVRLMVLGGETMNGPRYISWNFVASCQERVDVAKETWRQGDWEHGRFRLPPGDEVEFTPLPD